MAPSISGRQPDGASSRARGIDLAQSDDTPSDVTAPARSRSSSTDSVNAESVDGEAPVRRPSASKGSTSGSSPSPDVPASTTTDRSETFPSKASGSFLPLSLLSAQPPPPFTSQPPCFSRSRSRLSLRAPREEEKQGGWDVVVLEGRREHEDSGRSFGKAPRLSSRADSETSFRECSRGSPPQDGLWAVPRIRRPRRWQGRPERPRLEWTCRDSLAGWRSERCGRIRPVGSGRQREEEGCLSL